MLEARLFIGGQFIDGAARSEVINKYSGECIGTYPNANDPLISAAIAAGASALQPAENFPAHKRADVLDEISNSLKREEARFAETICLESAKPIKLALAEVRRAQQTFRFAASCARNIEGASIRLDAAVGSESKYGFFLRVPVGLVVAISPFNFPLNLVAHKVAPAIAAGCPIILKPASYTPLTSFLLAEMISKTDLPAGAFNLIFGAGNRIGTQLVCSHNVRAVTFTGSPEIGRDIARNAGIKRLILELGSNSAVIVDKSADLESAVPRIVGGAFAYSGQVCISVQRVYVHETIFKQFLDHFITRSKQLVTGDPMDEKTDIGPMITENEAVRVESWVREAVSDGAKIMVGGNRNGAFLDPTVLTNTSQKMKVISREIFGPVVSIMPYDKFDHALDMVNDSVYGLQAGVFTSNIDQFNQAIHSLKVGGVIINDVPTYRADNMPYGGVKLSGLGREGVKYAIEEMTDIKMVAIQR